MKGTKIRRGAAGIAALTIALGTAGPAFAKPVDDPGAPNVKHPGIQSWVVVATPTGPQATSGSDSPWPYVAIGGGVAGLAVLGVGGTLAVGRRRHRTAEAARPTIAT